MANESGSEPGSKKPTVRLVKNGITYVYENESYWDKVKKQPRSKRKLIGHIDPKTGEVVPNRKYEPVNNTARTFVMGPSILFDRIADNIGLKDTLMKTLPKQANAILTCAYYMLSEGTSLSRCEQWSAGAINPYGKRLGDQRISELLNGLNTDIQMKFFKEWMSVSAEKDTYALDITSISSYSEEIDIVRAGYNRDHENLEQINLALLIGSKTYRPVFFSLLPGNINDKASLNRFVATVKAVGFTEFRMVMDKGFCTKKNIDMLYEESIKFTISMTANLKFTDDAIKEVKDTILKFGNYHKILGSNVYVATSLRSWGEHRCYTHVYFDERKKDKDIGRFTERLWKVKNLLEENLAVSEKDTAFSEKYFRIKETPKRGRRVEPNEEEIEAFRNRTAGFLVLISNCEKDPVKCLEVYRAKETAESGFDDLKNDEGLYRLRVHSEENMEGKLFVAFVALAIKMELNRLVYGTKDLENRTVQEIIDEMKLLRCTFIESRTKPLITELTKLQKLVMKTFGVKGEFDVDAPESADDPDI